MTNQLNLDFEIPGGFDKPEKYELENDEGRVDHSLVRPDDIAKTIPDEEQRHIGSNDGNVGYWLEEGYSFALILYSQKESEFKYYVIQPHLTDQERILIDFLDRKLQKEIDFNNLSLDLSKAEFETVIQRNLFKLLRRFGLAKRDTLKGTENFYSKSEAEIEESRPTGLTGKVLKKVSSRMYRDTVKEYDIDELDHIAGNEDIDTDEMDEGDLEETALNVRPLNELQVDKILYYLVRDYIGLGKVEPLLHDVNLEDVSADGYHHKVWVYHNERYDIPTNIEFHESDLDEMVQHMAEADGKGISKRQPMVDVTLPDGSRVQVTLGDEVSEKGSNFTIRLFKDVPFTPVDLIHWKTYSIEEMAYLWMAVEHNQKIIFAGSTASGKTTSLNAVSLFVPKAKIVSIEDTPELTLPHDNWVESTTREHEGQGDVQNYEMFDLLKAALRQRPEYIVMGEVRDGEAARALFQAISSGHTTLTTFHAGTVEGAVNRFTHEPLNINETQFAEMDLICLQEMFTVDGNRQRRAKSIVEVGDFEKETGTVDWSETFSWDALDDTHKRIGNNSELLERIRRKNGWTTDELWEAFNRREVVLAYLIRNGVQDYREVAGIIQAFMRNPEGVMHLIATDELEGRVQNLTNLESLDIDVNEEDEERIIRPVSEEAVGQAARVLDDHAELIQDSINPVFDDAFTDKEEREEEIETVKTSPFDAATDAATESVAEPVGNDPLMDADSGSGDLDAMEFSTEEGQGQSDEGIIDPIEAGGGDIENGDDAIDGEELNDEPKESAGEDSDEEEDDRSNSGGLLSSLFGFGSSSDSNEEDSEDEVGARDKDVVADAEMEADTGSDESEESPEWPLENEDETSESERVGDAPSDPVETEGVIDEGITEKQTDEEAFASQEVGPDWERNDPDAQNERDMDQSSTAFTSSDDTDSPFVDEDEDEAVQEAESPVASPSTADEPKEEKNPTHWADRNGPGSDVSSDGEDVLEHTQSSDDSQDGESSTGDSPPSKERPPDSLTEAPPEFDAEDPFEDDPDSSTETDSGDTFSEHSGRSPEESMESPGGMSDIPPEGEDGQSPFETDDADLPDKEPGESDVETKDEEDAGSPAEESENGDSQPTEEVRPSEAPTSSEESRPSEEARSSEEPTQSEDARSGEESTEEEQFDPFKTIADDTLEESHENEREDEEESGDGVPPGESDQPTADSGPVQDEVEEGPQEGADARSEQLDEQDDTGSASDDTGEADVQDDVPVSQKTGTVGSSRTVKDEPDDLFREIGEIQAGTSRTTSQEEEQEQDTPTSDDPAEPAHAGEPSEQAEVDTDTAPDSSGSGESSRSSEPGGKNILDEVERGKSLTDSQRERLLNLPTCGETEQDVMLDNSSCLEVVYIEEWNLYRQCETPIGEESRFCHLHRPNQEVQADGGTEE